MTFPIVFLHIPKTAGQTIHNVLVEIVGGEAYVSPVRVHTQAPNGKQMPRGYKLYSGHIDWCDIDNLPDDRFAFTVLRDPRERIASFYFYLQREASLMTAQELNEPHNTGKKNILANSADDYFFGGDDEWRKFIIDHYDNFYCAYLSTRMMRGRSRVALEGTSSQIVDKALEGAFALQKVYLTEQLAYLEEDLEAIYGRKFAISDKYVNVGGHRKGEARWPKLLSRLESDKTKDRLERFVEYDLLLMQRLFPGT